VTVFPVRRGHRARQHARGPVTRPILAEAFEPGFKDHEDAVLHAAARQAGGTAMVTRDPAGFTGSRLRIYGPAELLRLVQAAQ
jgi:hypothetical protein